MKKLIDTSVLVYLVDAQNKSKHKKAISWFESIFQSDEYFISVQNIREFIFVVKKKDYLKDNELLKYVELFIDSFNVIYDNISDIKSTIYSKKKEFWDDLLTATAKRNGIIEIITENEKDFKGKIKTLNIFTCN